jgi:hypothetical protein
MVQHSTNAYCLCSEDLLVYKYVYQTGKFQCLFRLPCPFSGFWEKWKHLLLRTKLLRLFRRNIGIHEVLELPSGTILAIYDYIYRYAPTNTSGVAEQVASLREIGFKAPLKNGVAVNLDNHCVYFGEYQSSRPYAVKVMRLSNDGRQAEICYTFPLGQIRHIHSIIWDAFRHRLWIATGDNNAEAGLYYTDDDFQTVSYFQGGSQQWRMVSLLPTRDALYWGSDAGRDAISKDQNFIFRWDFRRNALEKICPIDYPAYYSAFLNNGGMLVGTTYEPGIVQHSEPTAALWYSPQGEQWQKICTIPYKNLRKTNRTQYATINLPKGVIPETSIMITPLNTQRWDFDLVAIKL